jgi:hypothetical protein
MAAPLAWDGLPPFAEHAVAVNLTARNHAVVWVRGGLADRIRATREAGRAFVRGSHATGLAAWRSRFNDLDRATGWADVSEAGAGCVGGGRGGCVLQWAQCPCAP